MKRQLILSTIGTSLLTNQINRKAEAEATWLTALRDTANHTNEDLPGEVQSFKGGFPAACGVRYPDEQVYSQKS